MRRISTVVNTNAGPSICYFCGQKATTREHYPPKSFFPNKGEGLQLKTVPSCQTHNNEKSHIDQYVLGHITMNQGRDLNEARRVFDRSIKPQLAIDKNFKLKLVDGSDDQTDGTVRYRVDRTIFGDFFDALTRAVLFDRFSIVLPSDTFKLNHVYLAFQSDRGVAKVEQLAKGLGYDFFTRNKTWVTEEVHDHLDKFVYRRKIMAPLGYSGSISVLHTFYDFFDVLTLASNYHSINAILHR